ncbi:CwfJ C-terminus 1-domain-containing protein-like protein [Cokeromyces recurvatus]|uniref:CwfJ C-terminus 1-domain-containing protein-like protein n=1 Tax=Cokeromyces recurvatus TaxID=90255 RepID=UPI00221EF473|nr:CwfJ C-terminus 1-domain-containing protein-like protein [Cokeromyces recurvatus]KAI7901005.1 CwfJ C-terminus 1-domain-containing protein-like protein [Cokeromyces recurvatus]
MGDHKHKKSSSKREHHRDSSKSHREHKKHKRSSSHHKKEEEIDLSDPSLWVESSHVPELTPAEQLRNQQRATEVENQQEPIEAALPEEQEARHGWMLDRSFDFADMGTARIKEEKPKRDPDQPFVSERELNQHLVQGKKFEEYPAEEKRQIKFGDAGSNWRMMKLKRTMEQAEDEGRPLREVGIERYGSAEKFEEALAEREYLDKKKRGDKRHSHRERGRDRRNDAKEDDERDRRRRREDRDEQRHSSRKYVFHNTEVQQNAFKRPEAPKPTNTTIASDESKDIITKAPSTSQPQPPPLVISHSTAPTIPALTRDQLNKLNAKLVKARLMGSSDLEELEKEYQIELERFEQAEKGISNGNVTVLPTLDSQGRIYDYALNQGNPEQQVLKGKKQYEGTHDKLTGERLRYGTADDYLSLADMVRQEKGGNQSFNMDMEFANRIASDASFQNDLDYMDDKADIMASKKGVTEQQKMRRAITDYKRTQEILERCRLCYKDGNPPQIAMISLANTCYLALPNVQELTPGHCWIVPLQHVSSSLECDDDFWTEFRNFQKCLLKMFHEQGKGVIFMETVVNLRSQRHTVIEAIPIPYGIYEDAPAYFKEAIMASEEEWSQHKKLIDTSDRGFRNSMVKNLPYFHVWLNINKGYGHVIENPKDFPYWFGKEVIGGMLDIGPELWRKPRYHHSGDNHHRQQEFLKKWEKWDWTAAL